MMLKIHVKMLRFYKMQNTHDPQKTGCHHRCSGDGCGIIRSFLENTHTAFSHIQPIHSYMGAQIRRKTRRSTLKCARGHRNRCGLGRYPVPTKGKP